MAPVVKDTHAVVRIRQALEHPVEAVHRDVRNEHGNPGRTQSGAPPPCGREPTDITWPETPGRRSVSSILMMASAQGPPESLTRIRRSSLETWIEI